MVQRKENSRNNSRNNQRFIVNLFIWKTAQAS